MCQLCTENPHPAPLMHMLAASSCCGNTRQYYRGIHEARFPNVSPAPPSCDTPLTAVPCRAATDPNA